MAQDLIADQDTGINVAIMRGGEVFRDVEKGRGLPLSLMTTCMILMVV